MSTLLKGEILAGDRSDNPHSNLSPRDGREIVRAEMGKLPTQREIQPSVAEGIKEWEATQEHPTKVARIDRNDSVTFTPSDRGDMITSPFPRTPL